MPTKTYNISGERITELEKFTDSPILKKLKIKAAVQFSPVARSKGTVEKIEVNEEDVCVIHFDDGSRWYGSPSDVNSIISVKEQNKDIIEISGIIDGKDSRGIGSFLKGFIGYFTKSAFNEVFENSVKKLALQIDYSRVSQEGLFKLSKKFEIEKIKSFNHKPYLILIHGTMSNTMGSFSGMYKENGGKLWNALIEKYGENNILCFEHYTLGKSVLENLNMLLDQLPNNNNELHIISQSRGGLILDLLSLCSNEFKSSKEKCLFNNDEKKFFENLGRNEDIEEINEIDKKLKKLNVRVTQAIRVACPGFGTSILGENLNHFFNNAFLIAKFIPGLQTVAMDVIEQLAIATINMKNEEKALPGLENMNPESPFLKLLNLTKVNSNIKTLFFAGKAEVGSGIWHSIKALVLTNFIFERQNDFVVDTSSMSKGALRSNVPFYYLNEGDDVQHHNYFKNEVSQNILINCIEKGLENVSEIRLLKSTDGKRSADIDRGNILEINVSGTKPLVILIPGIMGSSLAIKGDKIWINYTDFMLGKITKLKIENDAETFGIVESCYGNFIRFLKSNEYDVYTFAYDWRKSVKEAAIQLNDLIEDKRKTFPNLQIKFVTHSMGGLVMREFMYSYSNLFGKLQSEKSFRWIMLGTPWLGSYGAVQTLLGQKQALNFLSYLDLLNNKGDLLNIFSKYPGLYELLPINYNTDLKEKFETQQTWNNLKKIKKDLMVFEDKFLDEFSEYKTRVLEKYKEDNVFHNKNTNNIFYIAGKSEETPFDLVKTNENIYCDTTTEGDGTVTWLEGIPEHLKNKNQVYYINKKHGQLLNDLKSFKGILELIEEGRTQLLSQSSGSIRGSKVKETWETKYRNNSIPSSDLEDVVNAIFDYDQNEEESENYPDVLEVTLRHGDLIFSDYPVMVGHFVGDAIVNAEAALDEGLNNALRIRHRLNAYPDNIGDFYYIFKKEDNKPKGGLIVGLGELDKLSSYQLSETICKGLINAILEHNQSMMMNETPLVGISSLLIASDYGNMSIETSIRSILDGFERANKAIMDQNKLIEPNQRLAQIRKIEFVELYEDKAIASFLILKKLNSEGTIIFDQSNIGKSMGAKKTLRINRGGDKWHSLKIVKSKVNKESKNKLFLEYNLNTDLAREEAKDIVVSKSSIESGLSILSKQSEESSEWNKEKAKVVFELMIPYHFKGFLRNQNNLLLNLDMDTAAYPWELVQDTVLHSKPLVVNCGLVRKLVAENYRTNPNYVFKNTALIIGDPLLHPTSNYKPLDGAKAEALKADQYFKQFGIETKPLINKNRDEIMEAWVKDYKYIHISAHGNYNEENDDENGIVIGFSEKNGKFEDVYLSIYDFVNASTVPDFVFINCCWVGKVNTQKENITFNRHGFAANIGVQLIQNGVKAVIVAGWPIHDDMALEFADKFYDEMFRGQFFGQAVLKARQKIYSAFPDNNTWGAYQCYGDPYYQFNVDVKNNAKSEVWLEEELLVNLSNILSQCQYKKDIASLQKKLEECSNQIIDMGCKNGEILEYEAKIYHHIGMLKIAYEKYKKLMQLEKSNYSSSAMEQWLNVQAKYYIDSPDYKYEEAVIKLEKIVRRIESLQKFGDTKERNNILASTYKRIAFGYIFVADSRAKIEYFLAQSIQHYENAIKDDKSDFYSTMNLIQLKVAHLEFNKNEKITKDLKSKYNSAEKNYTVFIKKSDDYYDRITKFNFEVTKFILYNYFKSATEDALNVQNEVDRLMSIFSKIWDNTGSRSHLNGEIEHYHILAELLDINIKAKRLVYFVLRGIVDRMKKM